MIKTIIAFYILFALISSGETKESIREQVEGLLPSELTSLSVNNTRDELEKKFAPKVNRKDEATALYLHYFEDKNDVTIGFKKNHFDYLYVEIPRAIVQKKANFYLEVVAQLTSTQKESIARNNKKDLSHEGGRYIVMDLPEEKMKLEFYNNEKKELRSVVLFNIKKN